MRPPVYPRFTGLSLPLTLAALSIACSDATSPPASPAAPRAPHLTVGPVVTVTNTDDAGPGSLRQAMADAADGSTIQFDAAIAGQSIVLATGALQIDKPLTIEGPVPAGMTVSGGLVSNVFTVGVSGDVVFRNLSIVDGRALDGAGIRSGGKVTLDHSLVANNEVVLGERPRGGGIYSTNDAAVLTLVNSTVSGNIASNGGGINSQGILIIRNSTITANSGIQGGGILAFGPVNVRNSIIAHNVDRTDPTIRPLKPNCDVVIGTKPLYSGVNISNDDSCGTDPALLIADPKLGPFANNGGPTKTHALLPGSPAIDLGGQCTEATDQRWVARTQGASCDVGAFEFDSYTRLTLTVGPNAMVDPKTGVATVSGTIACTAPGTIDLDVALSQTQKTTGRFTTIVQAAGQTSVNCVGTSSWSLVLTPPNGKFANGSATSTVETTTVPVGFLPASVTAPLRLFAVR